MTTINMIINFSDNTEVFFSNPAYIPNIGENVQNEKDPNYFYFVTRKSIYYTTNNLISVIIHADKKQVK